MRIANCKLIIVAAAILALLGISGCNAAQPTSKPKGDPLMPIKVTSTAFQEGQPIPKKYTGEDHPGKGPDISPPLSFSGVPSAAKELALICDDPDAPNGTWVHWVLYKIPPDTTSLPEGIPQDLQLKSPVGAIQGKNSWPEGKNIGYGGPMPPPGHGTHHYHFKVYALDVPVSAPPGVDKKTLLKEMENHILVKGELMGTYERKK